LEYPAPAAQTPSVQIFDPMVKPASGGCASCGMAPGASGYPCFNGTCVPGKRCFLPDSDSVCGRLFGGICQELCCPDPCYEPRWLAEANAAFFQDSPRPITQTRIRWDAGFNYRFPDTSEFFIAQEKLKGPKFVVNSLRYDDLSLYQEIAAKGASLFFEFPYRNVNFDGGPGANGFGDMNLGTKAVLLDTELLLLTFQFRTYILMGNFTAGLGTGHVSLEPSLLAAIKLCPQTYLQTELSEWIPLGGSQGFASSVLHYHFSLNTNLYHCGTCVNVIGTLEFNGWTFNGEFTDESGVIEGANRGTFCNAGPGIRLQICDHFDIGFAAAWGFGDHHGPGSLYRTELRVRY
jgi:hypothetical protein